MSKFWLKLSRTNIHYRHYFISPIKEIETQFTWYLYLLRFATIPPEFHLPQRQNHQETLHIQVLLPPDSRLDKTLFRCFCFSASKILLHLKSPSILPTSQNPKKCIRNRKYFIILIRKRKMLLNWIYLRTTDKKCQRKLMCDVDTEQTMGKKKRREVNRFVSFL